MFFSWGNYSAAVFLLSIKNWLLFCIYLVKLTSVVVNQDSVIPPFLSELPAKIHSTEGPSCISSSLCWRSSTERTSIPWQSSPELRGGTGLTAVWSSWVLPRTSHRWRLCILGRSAIPRPAGVKAWPDKADKTEGETRPRSTNRPKHAGGRQNKHDGQRFRPVAGGLDQPYR